MTDNTGEAAYRAHLPLLVKLSKRYADSCRLEFDELFGEATLAFWQACLDYRDGEGVKLITLVYRYVANHLHTVVQKELMVARRRATMTDHAKIRPAEDEDRDLLIRKALSAATLRRARARHPKRVGLGVRKVIESYLRELGWSATRIAEAYADVRNFTS